jgi:hypothetical protein
VVYPVVKLVYYSQDDPRWKNVLYSNHRDSKQTIGASACGPTCFAMAASSFLGRSILPPEMAFYAIEHGYRTKDNGTDWGFFASAAKAYGLVCKQSASLYDVKAALSKGALVIASMGPGHVTGGGHYILLVGINGKMIDVFDPNHDNTKYGNDGLIDQGIKNDGKVRINESVFQKEARQYWIITAPIKEEEEPMLSVKDANLLIARFIKPDRADALKRGDKVGAAEAYRLANELRKASGQPTQ